MSDTARPSAPPRREPRPEAPRPLIVVPDAPEPKAGAESIVQPLEAPVPPLTPPVTPPAGPEPSVVAPTPSKEPAKPSRAASRLRHVLTVGGTLLALFILWETFTYFVAYTDDAYVRSDLVSVAPQVTGPVIAVHVVDNQEVKAGDKLFTIDPTPFQLEVNQRLAQIEEQTALVKVAEEQLASAKASLEAATSAQTFAAQQQARYAVLAAQNDAPRERLDQANNDLRRATADRKVAEVDIAKAQTSIKSHQGALDVAKAELATAQWKLSRTEVFSPTTGAITNLTLRKGDMATANIPLIGIVDANAFRVMANYKQYYVRDFKIGGTAWIWLDSAPWRFYRGRITGIARGISRDPNLPMLLPYVAPTTDWIRLQRRIPVTIVLDELPPGGKLYMGADARTVIFP